MTIPALRRLGRAKFRSLSKEGEQAFKEGKSNTNCPWPFLSPERDAWLNGWFKEYAK